MKSLTKRIFGLGLILVAAGTLSAQPTKVQPTSDSAAAQADQIKGFRKDAVEAQKAVQILQIQARKDKDSIRLSCINDKLIQIKALRNILDDLLIKFDGASNPLDQSGYFDQLRDNWNKVRVAREQALACVGEVQFQSESEAGWKGPDIPDNPGDDLFPGHPEEPGYASPFN